MFGLGLGLGKMGAVYRAILQLYNPATQFAPALLGALWLPDDYATQSQDSAGTTPVTGVTQLVGRMLDKSGRSNTISQATAPSRPVTGAAGAIKYLTFDGVDDGMSTGAITLSANMDCFIAVRRNSAASGVVCHSGTTKLFAYYQSGATGASIQGCGGAATTFVDGVAVGVGVATTGDQLHLALTGNVWHVVEARNLDLSTFTPLQISQFSGLFVSGDIAGIILCPAGDATARQKNRQYLGAKVGLVLP